MSKYAPIDTKISVDLTQFPLQPGQALDIYVDTILTPEMRREIISFFQEKFPNNEISVRGKPANVTFSVDELVEYFNLVGPSDVAGDEWEIKINGPYAE